MSRSTLFKLVLSIVWVTLVLMLFASRGRGLTQVGGIFAAIAAAFAVVFGPQMVRYDLRQDLQHLELLKTWPVRAASVIRGQILGATVVVTLVAWGLGLVAFALSAAAFPTTVDALRVAAGLASLIAVPALVMAQFTVHNAAALLLPAWFGSSGTRPRGIDAMGQRLIMLAGTWIVLVAGVLPAVLVGGMLWWLFEPAVGPWILIPAAVVGTLMVAAEVGVVAEALAPAYEQLDITGIERDA